MALLVLASHKLMWWPLHPIGYLISLFCDLWINAVV
jgi:hypothetical protein